MPLFPRPEVKYAMTGILTPRKIASGPVSNGGQVGFWQSIEVQRMIDGHCGGKA